MTVKVLFAQAYNRRCYGCEVNDSDVMIAVQSISDKPIEVIDLFLSQDQAAVLLESLTKAMTENVTGRLLGR